MVPSAVWPAWLAALGRLGRGKLETAPLARLPDRPFSNAAGLTGLRTPGPSNAQVPRAKSQIPGHSSKSQVPGPRSQVAGRNPDLQLHLRAADDDDDDNKATITTASSTARDHRPAVDYSIIQSRSLVRVLLCHANNCTASTQSSTLFSSSSFLTRSQPNNSRPVTQPVA
ncbi:hypothetical protein BD289DRAFT_188312 [Coniella lustricola]|uniref:Uncharacterized protein n=1 Tax=Coniella lustricola TaxID=2025994 RepID=A0A2T2ZSZ9_9PEZI|nr:hypothetical protein BD289DRAFT_188312 [Coniella lustricola]